LPLRDLKGLTFPLVPQDKESCGSKTSHEENVQFIFEESRTLPLQSRRIFITNELKQVKKRVRPTRIAEAVLPFLL
jgi:hypothetical protein